MKLLNLALAGALALLVAAPALSQTAAPMTERTQKLFVEGRRGESLLKPGYALGEYAGGSSGVARSVRAAGVVANDSMKAAFTVTAPQISPAISAECSGRAALTKFLWITFKEDPVSYVCTFKRGDAPAQDISFVVAFQEGTTVFKRLQGPQRAAEMRYGAVTLRAETRATRGPITLGGATRSYVFSKDGVDVGGIDISGLRPTVYLPPAGSPDRDAAAVMAIALFFFRDPANQT